MYIKLFGALAALSAFLMAGLACYTERKRQYELLEAIRYMLVLLRAELDTSASSMEEILAAVKDILAPPAATFVHMMAESMGRLGEDSFESLWRQALDYCFPQLDAAVAKSVRQLGNVLGRYELSQQLRELDNAIIVTTKRADELSARLPSEKRLALGLSGALGLMLVIILI